MSASYQEVYQLALTLPPEDRQRLIEALSAASPSDLSADFILSTLAAHAAKLREMGVRRIGLFGSHARGDARLDSDIDLLVEMAQPRYSLFAVAHIGEYLQRIFCREVDPIPVDVLRPEVRPAILEEVIYAEIGGE